jgi:type IV pilus assembly protein PilV
MKTRMTPPATSSQGFTLVEVLIAVLVLSLGLLGLAGLQANSLKFNTSAAVRGQATLVAYDIIDRMRANRDAALAGAYDDAMGIAPTAGGTDCQAVGSTCTANQMASYDLNQWKCLLGAWKSNAVCTGTLAIPRGLLPNADGSVTRNGNQFVVTITWNEIGWDPNNPNTRASLPVSLAIGAEL